MAKCFRRRRLNRSISGVDDFRRHRYRASTRRSESACRSWRSRTATAPSGRARRFQPSTSGRGSAGVDLNADFGLGDPSDRSAARRRGGSAMRSDARSRAFSTPCSVGASGPTVSCAAAALPLVQDVFGDTHRPWSDGGTLINQRQLRRGHRARGAQHRPALSRPPGQARRSEDPAILSRAAERLAGAYRSGATTACCRARAN